MITIEINDSEVMTALDHAMAALTDMTPLMQDLGEMLLASTNKRFGQGVAPDGTPWAKNSPVTLARKKDKRPLFGPNNRLNNEFGLVATATSAEISTVLPYAATQQFGAAQGAFGARMGRTQKVDKVKSHDYFFPIPWGDIPARPFLGLSEDDRQNILDEIAEYLSGALST